MITEQLIDEIASRLENNLPVRTHLPGGGRVHIDRQLPFLVIYRHPPQYGDTVTGQLLLGEASYLLEPDTENDNENFLNLIRRIAAIQSDVFGAFLIIEIWESQLEQDTQLDQVLETKPAFTIFAPTHNVPEQLLEEFETHLLDVTIEGSSAQVALTYADRFSPPGLAPIGHGNLGDSTLYLGLEIFPVYRDQVTGSLFPFELKSLQRQLAHTFKHVFHVFSHCCTTHRPAHYHELGRQLMTKVVGTVDKQLAEIDSRFDLLLHVTPVNSPQALYEFKQHRFQKVPSFNYRPRPVDPDLLKRKLFEIPIEDIEDPTLSHIFLDKRDEIDRQLNMIAERNNSRFKYESLQVYGELDDELIQLADELLATTGHIDTEDEKIDSIDAVEFSEIAQAEINHYRQACPELAAQVQLRDDVPGVMVSRGNFLIGTDARVAKNRIEATLSHEIGTHVLTYYNGKSQPFKQLYSGMANYELLQEGLAVLSEYLTGQLSISRLRLLAARVFAVNYLLQGATFIDTFNMLFQDHHFAPDTAFTITMRVYRSGGFTKDAVYLRGLQQLVEYITGSNNFDLLLLGKFGFEHLPLIEELRWRKVLQPARLRPRYLDNNKASTRMKYLQSCNSVMDLVKECTA